MTEGRGTVQRWLWWLALALAAAVTLVCWAGSSPPGSSPDDDFHLASIWCADGAGNGATAAEICGDAGGSRTGGTINRLLPIGVVTADCGVRFPSIQECLDFKHRQVCGKYTGPPAVACSGMLPPGTDVHAANDGLYPAGFYSVMHLFVSDSVTGTILWIRAVNGLLVMCLAGLAFAVSSGRTRAAYALSLVVGLMTPIGLLFIPSTNPSSWAIIGVGTLWLFVLVFVTTPVRWRQWAAAAGGVLSWATAVGSRADAPVLAALTVGAAAVIGNGGLRPSRRLLLPAALILGSVAVFLLGSGTNVASSGISTVAAGDGTGISPDVAAQLAHNLAHPWSLFFHNLGSLWAYEQAMFAFGSQGNALVILVLVLLLAAMGLYRGWPRAAYVALLLAGLAIPLYVAQRSHLGVSSWYLQRRYVFPLMVALVGLAAYALVRSGRGRALLRPVPLVVLWLGVSLISSIALHAHVRSYVIGWQSGQLNLDSPRIWWWSPAPVSPNALWLIGSAAMAAMFALLLRVAVQSLSAAPSDSAAPTTIDPRESSTA